MVDSEQTHLEYTKNQTLSSSLTHVKNFHQVHLKIDGISLERKEYVYNLTVISHGNLILI